MRIIIILLSSLLIAESLTACGKKGDPARPSEVTESEQAAS
jgi:predicted small lipoprotein YifL